ncbi:MAG TPA: hypothetical protein VF665_00010 [Longimicrobium sp.]|uniref:hypothetical protein n=1 Tax=Longimicrobium sp. TaxID=2029185 RepID=UPI002EDAB1D9
MNSAARALPFARIAAQQKPKRPTPWVPGFIAFQLLCQLALIVGDIGWARVIVRIAAFGASLLLVFGLRGRGGPYPAIRPALAALGAVGICIFHPDTRSLTAGVAQVALYLAVLGPLFWVPRLTSIDLAMLRRAVLVLWGFHTLSAALGVMQVYRPGTFQPPVSAVVESKGKGYVESLKITTASGAKVFRPMGLTDVPGGASISGLYAVLLGVGFFLTRRKPLALAASLGSIGLGVMCLYLSQVRALVVMTGIALVAVGAVLLFRRDFKRLSMLMVGVVGVVVAGYFAAVNMAGAAVAQRMATLVASRPGQVYYDNRGHFLEEAFTKTLPNAPLGEGLGHWGMTATYFGGGGPPTKQIWVEIQWAGWIVDGGAPFLLAYLAALAVALWTAWGIARSRPPSPEASDLPFWGAIVLAYSIGAAALTFSYPIFLSQSGMEFWLLNATLFAAARHARQAAAAARAYAA